MLSTKVKQYISKEVQRVLQSIHDDELPNGEIHFILHVDGSEDWSWANIRNESDKDLSVPHNLIRNITA